MSDSKSEKSDGKDAAAGATAKKKKNPKMLVVLIAAAVLLLGGGAAAFFLLRPAPAADEAKGDKGKDGKEAKDEKGKKKGEKAKKPSFVDFEMFTVNLKDPEKFLQIKLTFQVASNEAAEGLKDLMPVVRSAVIPVLGSQDPAELATPEGKEKLSAQVVEAANKALAGGELADSVEAVLITHMIIQ